MLTIEVRGLDALTRKLEPDTLLKKALTRAMRKAATIVRKAVQAETPRRTGQARKAVRQYAKLGVSGRGQPRANTPLAPFAVVYPRKKSEHGFILPFLERGTKAHRIVPRTVTRGQKKGTLRLPFGRFTSVDHPGVRPVRMFEKARAQTAGAVNAALDEAARDIERVFGG